MASFTDAISQFNPYVQQLPVDAMAKVGMYKQQQYDQGVQKVQSYIDNVAGMDVANDADKVYLQSKLNELGGKLKTVAAGDFSNQQLVNSVGGMATQIIKDPTIQTAVSSTAYYNKGISQIQSDIEKGKANSANTWDFMNKAESWRSSTKAGTPFRNTYTPPTADPTKKALEAIKALHSNLQNVQIPFEIKNGKINMNKIAAVMQENKVEGVTERQIATAVGAVLDANDYNQLAIEGRYRFRDTDANRLKEISTQDYNTERLSATAELKYLKEQRPIVLSDPKKSAEIDERISYYENQLGKDGKPGKLEESYLSDIENINNNPDAVKADIYKKGFINQFANAFKWSNIEKKYLDSPLKKVEMFNDEMKLKWATESRLSEKQKFDMMMDTKEYALKVKDSELKAREVALKELETFGDSGAQWKNIGEPADLVKEAIPTLSNVLTEGIQEAEGLKGELKNAGYNDSQINEMIEDQRKYGAKATKVPARALGVVQEYLRKESFLNSVKSKAQQLEQEAEDETFKNNPDFQILKRTTINVPRLENGKVVRTPLNIVDAIQRGDAFLNVDKAPAGYTRLQYRLPSGEFATYEIKNSESGAQFLNAPALRPILKKASEFFNTIKTKENKAYSEKLAPLLQEFIPRIKAVGMAKDGTPPAMIAANLASYVTAAGIQEIAADNNFDATTAGQMLSPDNIKNTRIFVHNKGNKYEVWLTDLNDVKAAPQKLRISAQDAMNVFGDKYINANVEDNIRVKFGRGNTNVTADPNDSVLQKQFGDFPGISRMQVTADLDRDVKNKDLYIPMVNILKKDGRYQTFVISGKNNQQRVGYDQGKSQLNGLTDSQLLSIIAESYPNYDLNLLDIK